MDVAQDLEEFSLLDLPAGSAPHPTALGAPILAPVDGQGLYPPGIGGRVHFDGPALAGRSELVRPRPGLWISLDRFTVRHDIELRTAGAGVVKFHFKLGGLSHIALDGGAEQTLDGPLASFMVHDSSAVKRDRLVGGTEEQSVTVAFARSLFEELFEEEHAWFFVGAGAGRDMRMHSAHLRNLPLQREMRDNAAALFDSPYTGQIRRRYAEAKALELTCSLMHSVNRPSSKHGEQTPRDLRRLAQARAALMEQLSSPPTLDDLARQVGMSRTRLASGFRLAYGRSVFEFHHELRMARALQLLKESDQPVGDLAASLGYDFQSSFAVAFKRHHGYSPSEARRGRAG